jgi:hypothetical protein
MVSTLIKRVVNECPRDSSAPSLRISTQNGQIYWRIASRGKISSISSDARYINRSKLITPIVPIKVTIAATSAPKMPLTRAYPKPGFISITEGSLADGSVSAKRSKPRMPVAMPPAKEVAADAVTRFFMLLPI